MVTVLSWALFIFWAGIGIRLYRAAAKQLLGLLWCEQYIRRAVDTSIVGLTLLLMAALLLPYPKIGFQLWEMQETALVLGYSFDPSRCQSYDLLLLLYQLKFAADYFCFLVIVPTFVALLVGYLIERRKAIRKEVGNVAYRN